MVSFFVACGPKIVTFCSAAEAADEATSLGDVGRSSGFAVVMSDDGNEVEVVGDFDLIRPPRASAGMLVQAEDWRYSERLPFKR